jgi:hypothetical protein
LIHTNWKTLKLEFVEPLYMQESNPTEPANYMGSYYTGAKEIVHMEIAMQEMLE